MWDLNYILKKKPIHKYVIPWNQEAGKEKAVNLAVILLMFS